MQIYNSLTRKKEDFVPVEDELMEALIKAARTVFIDDVIEEEDNTGE